MEIDGQEFIKMLKDDAFYIDFNMNDIFVPAGDGLTVDIDDVFALWPLYKKYGSIVWIAFSAVKDGGDPTWSKSDKKPGYWESKREIEHMKEEGVFTEWPDLWLKKHDPEWWAKNQKEKNVHTYLSHPINNNNNSSKMSWLQRFFIGRFFK